jgi:hypothetical protein
MLGVLFLGVAANSTVSIFFFSNFVFYFGSSYKSPISTVVLSQDNKLAHKKSSFLPQISVTDLPIPHIVDMYMP